jgi:hypothetical protein
MKREKKLSRAFAFVLGGKNYKTVTGIIETRGLSSEIDYEAEETHYVHLGADVLIRESDIERKT